MTRELRKLTSTTIDCELENEEMTFAFMTQSYILKKLQLISFYALKSSNDTFYQSSAFLSDYQLYDFRKIPFFMPFFPKVWPIKVKQLVILTTRAYVLAIKRLADLIIVYCLTS
jgi:hypothetical protein